MANEFARNIRDAGLIITTFFPAAGVAADSVAFDLVKSDYKPEDFEFEIAWPTLPDLVDAKTIIFTVQDSADNSSFTTLEMTHTITGAGGVGVAGGSKRFRLPSNTRRYVNVNHSVLAAAGDNTGKVSTLSLLF